MPVLETTAVVVGGGGASLAMWMWYNWRAPPQPYPSDVQYESLSAEEKMQLLWKRCKEDHTSGPLTTTKQLMWDFAITQTFHPTMHFHSDELYTGTKKYIHPVGGVCTGVFESTGGHNFTGVLACKSSPIIFRMSYGGQPSATSAVPGIALKFLRTGLPSVNIMAMKDLDGVPTGNFFRTTLMNHIGRSDNLVFKAVERKFAHFSPRARMLGLCEFGFATTDGEELDKKDVVFPFRLIFEPNPELAEKPEWKDLKTDYPLEELYKQIPVGAVLYTVKALPEPGAVPVDVGVIRSTSLIVSSKYGDTKLFFKHIPMDDDLKIHPEWTKGADEWMNQ
eukprot:TRINITY_DN3689_c5_g1_i1.p1 TRINITY_DN3689_c5_g1~~TRINITY_DN3689_c5_g1_i1.p1  ORF type:complete len:335 (+),score=68.68 TRINITY_DN3689_c5_g1_i1:49-1053(+)